MTACACSYDDGCHFPCAACLARDYAGLYRDGRCVLCGCPASQDPAAFHFAGHVQEGLCVIQLIEDVERVLLTRDVPIVDAAGVSIWEHDDTTWDRTDANSRRLREAYGRLRDTAVRGVGRAKRS